jgi:hypothetical protein
VATTVLIGAAELLDMKLLQVLGISLVTMGVISVLIFEFATSGGSLNVSSEGGHVKIMKGEEYETSLAVESRGNGWIGSTPTTFSIETGQLMEVEPLSDGTTIRLKFLGKYAGRSQGVRVGISFTDPLRLFKRLNQIVSTELVLDTMPLSLLAPELQRRLKVIGYGERSTGNAGQGQELYKLDEFNPGYTKDIVWRRVAKSADETLVARVREANVRDVVRVGVVRFAERGGDDRAAWTDKLCEALGEVGREVLETGASPIILYHHGPPAEGRRNDDETSEEERSRGLTRIEAEDIDELAEAVMSCSVASDSRDVEGVVADSDLVVTGLRELEDEGMAMVIAQKPLLLLHEKASPLPAFAGRSVIWTGKEDLLPLIRKTLER